MVAGELMNSKNIHVLDGGTLKLMSTGYSAGQSQPNSYTFNSLTVDDGGTIEFRGKASITVEDYVWIKQGGAVTGTGNSELDLYACNSEAVSAPGDYDGHGGSSGVGTGGLSKVDHTVKKDSHPCLPYGVDVRQPAEEGSSGFYSTYIGMPGKGGAALRLTVANELRVDGTLASGGASGESTTITSLSHCGGGGGGGGSLWLEVGSVAGTGTVHVNGGAAVRHSVYPGRYGVGGSGAAGAIALYIEKGGATCAVPFAVEAYSPEAVNSGTSGQEIGARGAPRHLYRLQETSSPVAQT
eukprot:g1659.t1